MEQITHDKEIHHIYDKIFKKILTLSGPAVIDMINGLFNTSHPRNSKLTYNWTEFIDDSLKLVLADTIITVNDKYQYHMEAQIENDSDIVFRVFDYGYKHAEQNKSKLNQLSDSSHIHYRLVFPEPHIIYIDSTNSTPDEYILEIQFGSQGSFLYKVKTFKIQEHSALELDQKKMIILIPFKLLTLRKIIARERTQENLDALHTLIHDDIIGSIRKNVEAGNLTIEDGIKLQSMTNMLYNHIYSRYEELEGDNDMTDESIMFPIDILEKKYEALFLKMNEDIVEKNNTIAEKDSTIAKKDAEIEILKKQLEELKR